MTITTLTTRAALLASLALLGGCDPKTSGGSTDASADDGGGCGGASATVLAGSCTQTVVGLTSCFEEYYGHALSASELDVFRQACSGGTFSTSGCSTTSVACKCVDTRGTFRTIRYAYGSYTDGCGKCTGDCFSTQ